MERGGRNRGKLMPLINSAEHCWSCESVSPLLAHFRILNKHKFNPESTNSLLRPGSRTPQAAATTSPPTSTPTPPPTKSVVTQNIHNQVYSACTMSYGWSRRTLSIELNYSGTWELWTPTGLWKSVLKSKVVLFLRSISVYWIGLGIEVAALNSQVVPISQVVLKTGFTVYMAGLLQLLHTIPAEVYV